MNDTADQVKLAQDVASKIKYKFFDYYLVKPLEPIKVKKEFSKPVSDGTPTEDKNGIKAENFNSVETEIMEVDSDFRRGVVLVCPTLYADKNEIKVGDVVIFRETAGLRYDLLKDSRLIKPYDVIGVERD